jgi:hypothetical protein
MNALAFWFEVLGSSCGLLLGRPVPLFVFELAYAFSVAYVLYWLVVHASGKDYKLVAIGLYVLYSLINIVQAMGSLILIVPPVFYFLKARAATARIRLLLRAHARTPRADESRAPCATASTDGREPQLCVLRL